MTKRKQKKAMLTHSEWNTLCGKFWVVPIEFYMKIRKASECIYFAIHLLVFYVYKEIH